MPVAGGPFIQKTGILLEVDAADKTSYPGSGTTWTNQIRPGTFNGTLNNISFNSSDANGALVFTGSNTFVDFGNLGPSLTSSFSFQVAFKPAATASGQPYTILSYASASATSSITFKLDYTSSNQTVVLTTFSNTGSQNIVYAMSASVNSGSWNIVHGTFGSTLAALYVNGLGQAYAPTTGSVVGYNASNRLYAGLNYGSTSNYFTGSVGNIMVNNADLDGVNINKNYNALAPRFSLPIRRVSITDADAFNFIEAAGITSETQIQAINSLVLGLKSNNLWSKMQVIYPFVGGNATAHRFNLKNPALYQIQWVGAIQHDSVGVKSVDGTGYGNTTFNVANFTTPSSSAHASVNISTTSTGSSGNYSVLTDFDTSAAGNNGLNLTDFYLFGSGGFGITGYGANTSTTADSTRGGLFVYSRNSTGSFEGYKRNSTQTQNLSVTGVFNSSSATSNTIRLLRGYSYTGQAGKLINFSTLGIGLSQTEVDTLFALINTYNSALSRS